MNTGTHDLIIVGGGPTGLCFASAAAHAGFRVALIESQSAAALANASEDGREIALTHRSRALMDKLGVWSHLPAEHIAPLRSAQVLNGHSAPLLDIRVDDDARQLDCLGYLVGNYLIRRAAYANAITHTGIDWFFDDTPADLMLEPTQMTITLRSQRVLQAPLLIAADSRHSTTRRMLGMTASMLDFGKTMLVCHMQHTQPHQHIAWEWFGERQTLALLPMRGNTSSVVITVNAAEAHHLMHLDGEHFDTEMTRRFEHRLGDMHLLGQRHAYPLVATYAHHFVKPRAALIGDAAVGMHPVTAHGFNLGLQGVDTLIRHLRTARQQGRDIGSLAVLQAYERQHQRDTRPLFLATNAIVRLYTDDRPLANLVRHAALRLANRVTPFKTALVSMLTNNTMH